MRKILLVSLTIFLSCGPSAEEKSFAEGCEGLFETLYDQQQLSRNYVFNATSVNAVKASAEPHINSLVEEVLIGRLIVDIGCFDIMDKVDINTYGFFVDVDNAAYYLVYNLECELGFNYDWYYNFNRGNEVEDQTVWEKHCPLGRSIADAFEN